jgi:hypothetical protein
MYQSYTRSIIKKVLHASAGLAAAVLVCSAVPASACTVSAGAKPQVAAPLPTGLSAMGPAMESEAISNDSKGKSHSFVGLWDSKVISGGQVIDEGFDAFHSDGTEILVDQSNPITDNVCLGVWEQTSPETIKLKHPSWYFDLNGNLLGTVIIYETLTIDADGDSFHGTSSEDVYDTKGNKIAHYGGFQIKAKRITAS